MTTPIHTPVSPRRPRIHNHPLPLNFPPLPDTRGLGSTAVIRWGVELFEVDRTEHSDAGVTSGRVVPALMATADARTSRRPLSLEIEIGALLRTVTSAPPGCWREEAMRARRLSGVSRARRGQGRPPRRRLAGRHRFRPYGVVGRRGCHPWPPRRTSSRTPPNTPERRCRPVRSSARHCWSLVCLLVPAAGLSQVVRRLSAVPAARVKHYGGTTRKGDSWLRGALGEAAASAARTKDTLYRARTVRTWCELAFRGRRAGSGACLFGCCT